MEWLLVRFQGLSMVVLEVREFNIILAEFRHIMVAVVLVDLLLTAFLAALLLVEPLLVEAIVVEIMDLRELPTPVVAVVQVFIIGVLAMLVEVGL